MKFEARRAGIKAGGSSTHFAPAALNQILFSSPRPHGRGYFMTVLRTSIAG